MPGPASTSPIKVDPSDTEFLVVCPEHNWFSFRFHRDEALESARQHELLFHPGDHRIRDSIRAATRRPRVADENPALSPEGAAIV